MAVVGHETDDHLRFQVQFASEYWSVDFPGLTEEGAEELVRLAAERGISGFSVDPDHFLTMGIDRAGAETIARALAGSEGRVAQGLLEVITEWLQNRP
jgi:hypothetical protein